MPPTTEDALVHRPSEPLSPERIDAYLAQGWFRFGGVMRTTRYSVWEERTLRTTLWIRSNLQDYRFSRSNRRLLSKVHRRYRVEHHPMVLDARHERLYAAYIVQVGGDRPQTLIDFLGGPEALGTYETQEISIWDEDELIAFSYYDAGDEGLMSLLGVFAPLYRKESLGMATLLLEIERAQQLDMRFHYSGYVLPGEPRMDYKLRAGAIEFLDPDELTWHPWDDFDPSELPDRRTQSNLNRVGKALAERGVRCRRMLNPLFELARTASLEEPMVDQPLMLLVGESSPLHIVTWNDPERCFVVELGMPAYVRHRRGADGPEHTTPTAIVRSTIGTRETAAEVASLLTPD